VKSRPRLHQEFPRFFPRGIRKSRRESERKEMPPGTFKILFFFNSFFAGGTILKYIPAGSLPMISTTLFFCFPIPIILRVQTVLFLIKGIYNHNRVACKFFYFYAPEFVNIFPGRKFNKLHRGF